jgi:hypothetical protein
MVSKAPVVSLGWNPLSPDLEPEQDRWCFRAIRSKPPQP